jgi:hypothetical protein
MDSYLTTSPARLSAIYEIAQVREWHPDLKHLSLCFYRSKLPLNDYLKAICEAFTLESLEIVCENNQLTQLPTALWTAQLKQIDIQYYHENHYYNKKLDLGIPTDFENQLERLALCVPCTGIVERLLDTPTLKMVRLHALNGQEYLHKALNVNHLEVSNFDKKVQKTTWYHLPLQTLVLRTAQNLPPLQLLPQLQRLEVSGTDFELENDWDALQNLEILSLKYDNPSDSKVSNSLIFKKLSNLKKLIIDQTNLTASNFQGGALPALESLELRSWKGSTLPESMFKSVFLKQIILSGCDRLKQLPAHLLTHPRLESLEILACPALHVSRQWAASGNPDTDGLVLALVRAGGIPPILIPELVMVTKMMEVPEPIRAGLRKLLKAKGDEATLKILSASSTPNNYMGDIFKYYRKKSPQFDYMSMSVCYEMRMKKGISRFFQFKESKNHPRRQEFFEHFCNQLSDNDFKVMNLYNMWFTPEEFTQLLSHPRAAGRLESLGIACFSNDIPEILFQHTTLTSLTLNWQGDVVPDGIGQFTKLTHLHLSLNRFNTLPVSLLNLQKLNYCNIHAGHRYTTVTLTLPIQLKDWIIQFNDFNFNFKMIWIES